MHRMIPLICVLTAGTALHAQPYPSKPIRMVVPLAAGGPSDISARNIAPRMTELPGASIVIDSRAGTSGFIGSEEFTAFIRKDIEAWQTFNSALRFNTALDDQARELAIQRVSLLTGADYQFH